MMAALLVTMSVMAVLLGALLPVWSTAARREREAELIFRGEQYARAIGLFQRKYANARPPSIDVLISERFLRKKYLDPISGGEFQILTTGTAMAVGGPGAPAEGRQGGARAGGPGAPAPPSGRGGQPSAGGASPNGTVPLGAQGQPQGGAGLIGVTSKSTEASLRIYNGRQRYNEWAFMPVQMAQRAGGPAAGPPGAGDPRGGRGRGAGPGGQPTGGAPGPGGGARPGTTPFPRPSGFGRP